MRLISQAGLVILALSLPLANAPIEAEQKPVQTVPLHVDGGPEPAKTLTELWRQADIVVDGTFTSSGRPTPPTVAGTVYTIYDFDLTEVFKADQHTPIGAKAIIVQRLGGIRDAGSHIVETFEPGFPKFLTGERYVLFLRYLPGGKYTPINAEFAFRITASTVAPRGKGDLARSLDGRPAADLTASLRLLRGVR